MTNRTVEQIAAYQAALAAHRARVDAMETCYHVGDEVHSVFVKTVIGGFGSMLIEKIDVDHTHGSLATSPHFESCYTESRIEYHVVVNPRPDGTAPFRARCKAHELVLLRRAKEAK